MNCRLPMTSVLYAKQIGNWFWFTHGFPSYKCQLYQHKQQGEMSHVYHEENVTFGDHWVSIEYTNMTVVGVYFGWQEINSAVSAILLSCLSYGRTLRNIIYRGIKRIVSIILVTKWLYCWWNNFYFYVFKWQLVCKFLVPIFSIDFLHLFIFVHSRSLPIIIPLAWCFVVYFHSYKWQFVCKIGVVKMKSGFISWFYLFLHIADIWRINFPFK